MFSDEKYEILEVNFGCILEGFRKMVCELSLKGHDLDGHGWRSPLICHQSVKRDKKECLHLFGAVQLRCCLVIKK